MNLKTLAGGTFIASALGFLKPKSTALLRTPATIHQDFEQDVLERLIKLGGNAFGAPVVGVKCNPFNASVKVMCMGFDSKLRWRKYSMNFSIVELDKWHILGDAQAVADVAYLAMGSVLPPEPEA